MEITIAKSELCLCIAKFCRMSQFLHGLCMQQLRTKPENKQRERKNFEYMP